MRNGITYSIFGSAYLSSRYHACVCTSLSFAGDVFDFQRSAYLRLEDSWVFRTKMYRDGTKYARYSVSCIYDFRCWCVFIPCTLNACLSLRGMWVRYSVSCTLEV